MTSDGSSHQNVRPLKVDIRAFMGLVWAGFALATICLFLRTYARIRQFNRLYIDDAFAILSLAFVLVSAILWQLNCQKMYDLVAVGAGLEMPGPKFADNVLAFETAAGIITIFYYSSLWSVKASFLLFIRRLGTNVTRIRYLWWVVCILTIAGYAGCIGATPYDCYFVGLETIITKCSTASSSEHSRLILKLNCAWDVITDVLSSSSLLPN
ncbi:CFEM domain-containing protein [Rutstroemia sp. NJR-2017a WRK4]|nr:CFEM domain-containing protein [Rutstroemia sp. NJR-2017a WRK4]